MHTLVRLAEALGRITARFVPSAFAIAVLLTAFTFALALFWTDASVPSAVKGWGDGFWELLTFSMQMALVMFTGYLLALTGPVRRLLEWVAGFASSPRAAVALMALASMLLAYINWGLSIVASAMLVRFVVRRQPQVDYRLLVACAYFGLGATWHAGLSASAPLLVATPKHFLEAQLGLIPIDRTLFSAFNLGLTALVIALMVALAVLLHPAPGNAVQIDPGLLEKLQGYAPPKPSGERSFAARLDEGPWLNWLFGALGLFWILRHLAISGMGPVDAGALSTAYDGGRLGEVLSLIGARAVPAFFTTGWKALNINVVNFLFLTLAVLLHRTPAALIKAAEEAGTVLHGVVLQFPLYAGIYGIFKATGLTERIGDLFVSLSTTKTFQLVVYWYSGIVNYFVPSGGSKWAIEAPYLIEAATRLHVSPEKVVLAYAWGDMATDLIQPFWAIPLLAVARLEFKDVLGFLLVAFFIYVPVVSVAFYLLG